MDGQAEAWYRTLPEHPFVFFSHNDKDGFVFKQKKGIETVSQTNECNALGGSDIGYFEEDDTISLRECASHMLKEHAYQHTKTAENMTRLFIAYLDKNHLLDVRRGDWNKLIRDAFAHSSPSSGESSTSNKARETLKQKPKDVKKSVKGITASPKTVERTNSSNSSEERQKIKESKKSDDGTKRHAHDRKEKKPDDRKEKKPDDRKEKKPDDRKEKKLPSEDKKRRGQNAEVVESRELSFDEHIRMQQKRGMRQAKDYARVFLKD